MTDRELMQKALEALKSCAAVAHWPALQPTITALRERLAQPEQEPVAWGVFDGPNLHDTFFTEDEAQEMVRLKGDGSIVKPLYTTPPRREWVGLTDGEIAEAGKLWVEGERMLPFAFARAIEAKLREKNA